jgi:hypothetical protein
MTMPPMNAPKSDDVLPPGRIVRWILLAGVILFSVGLYFRFGLRVPPLGSAPPPPPPASAASTTSTP